MSKWTNFYDLSSGGYEKTPHSIIAVEGDEKTARERFEAIFEADSHGCACECCGSDFSVDEYESLEALLEVYPNAFQVPMGYTETKET